MDACLLCSFLYVGPFLAVMMQQVAVRLYLPGVSFAVAQHASTAGGGGTCPMPVVEDSGVTATPEIVEWRVTKPSDAYVLVCSDGLSDAAMVGKSATCQLQLRTCQDV